MGTICVKDLYTISRKKKMSGEAIRTYEDVKYFLEYIFEALDVEMKVSKLVQTKPHSNADHLGS